MKKLFKMVLRVPKNSPDLEYNHQEVLVFAAAKMQLYP